MDASLIFAFIVGGLLLVLMLQQVGTHLSLFFRSQLSRWVFKHLVWPVVLPRQRLTPPVSRLEVIGQLCYWSVTAIFNMVGISGLSDAGLRAGSLAVFQMVPLMAGNRLSFIADFMGLSYHCLRYLHSSVGVMAVAQTVGHIVLMSRVRRFNLEIVQERFGILAGGSLLGLFLISLPFVRNVLHETFLKLHVGLAFFMFYSLWRHMGAERHTLRIALMSALGLFAVSSLLRGARIIYRNFTWKQQWARATIFPGNDVMEIQIKVPRPWVIKPGQYLYLWAPRVSYLSIFQSHPFSIAWWSEDANGRATTMSLLVEPHHGFTNSLRHKSNLNHSFRVAIDGPYGRTVDTSRYNTLVLFATGIGIAALMPLLKSAIKQSKSATTLVKRISVVWQLEEESDERWVASWMNKLLEEDNESKILFSSLYVAQRFDNDEDEENNYKGKVPIPYGKRVKKLFARADIREIMAKEMQERRGRTLVAVSAEGKVRDTLRKLMREYIEKDVDIQELDFQPHGWHKKEMVKHKGVI